MLPEAASKVNITSLEAALETQRRFAELGQSVARSVDVSGIVSMVAQISKNLAPIHSAINSLLKHQGAIEAAIRAATQMHELQETIRRSYTITLPSLRLGSNLEKSFRDLATIMAPKYGLLPTEVDEVMVRPALTEAKTVIRENLHRKKDIIPLGLPASVKWEHLRLRFVDGHNMMVEIPSLKKKFLADYKEMGMVDTRTDLPDKQWKLLESLAEGSGEVGWNHPAADLKLKKRKQLLAAALRRYFDIAEDPFGEYRRLKTYRLKFLIIPENLGADQGADPLGIKEYLSETSPSIYDPPSLR